MCGIMGGVFGDKRISYGPRSLAGSHRVRAMRGNGENVNATAVEQATEVKDDLSEGYRMPPESIAKIIDAPSVPAVSFSPCRTKILLCDRPPSNPPIAELVRTELKLAGARFDPALRAPSKMSSHTGMSIVSAMESAPLQPGAGQPITNIPDGTRINYVSWSPMGTSVAFAVRKEFSDEEVEPFSLWIADTSTGKARPILDRPMSAIFATYAWISDTKILCAVVPDGLPASPPKKPPVPTGPYIQEHISSDANQSRTYPDLLKSEHDCDLFEYYTSSDLVVVDTETGKATPFGRPGEIHVGISPSPDKRFVMLSYMQRPFSYAVPCGRFPKRVELWSLETGEMLREVAHLPLAEDIPIAFNSCRKGPRSIEWRSDKPADIVYAIAQDGGDPKVEVSGPRDVVFSIGADAFAAGEEPKEMMATTMRYSGIMWCDDDYAICFERWWKTRRSVWTSFSPSDASKERRVVFDRNYEDVYSDPGSPVMKRTDKGSYVLAKFGDKILMQGQGASPSGTRPFLDVFDLESKETSRVWQSAKDTFYEDVGSLLCDGLGKDFSMDEVTMLMTRESQRDPTQYHIMSWPKGFEQPPVERQITDFPHPYPQLRELNKQVLRYKRSDGVDLTGTLYTPPGYDVERDGPIPLFIWAYPREFKSKEAAGQVNRSSTTFASIGSTSPLLWLGEKYAILQSATMPIVGEGDEEPNDTYVEQLVSSAEAAIDEVVRLGVADRGAIAIGGHSYGAFMTANLLAHAPDLFCCGIARSGAYNRTLTPFGFQSEERTIWEATSTYIRMSPYLKADKITKPILLIHGDDDNNAGTSKIQSERFYSALKGHGVPSKLVLLPHESHGYQARESIMHCCYEMDEWLKRYCKISE